MGWGIEASAPAERRLRADLQGGRHFFLRGLREARSAGSADLGSGCVVVSLGLARRRAGTAAAASSAAAALASLRDDVLVSQHERRIEVHSRRPDGVWRCERPVAERPFPSASFAEPIQIDGVYRGVALDSVQTRERSAE